MYFGYICRYIQQSRDCEIRDRTTLWGEVARTVISNNYRLLSCVIIVIIIIIIVIKIERVVQATLRYPLQLLGQSGGQRRLGVVLLIGRIRFKIEGIIQIGFGAWIQCQGYVLVQLRKQYTHTRSDREDKRVICAVTI